jgi:hypothetical protein
VALKPYWREVHLGAAVGADCLQAKPIAEVIGLPGTSDKPKADQEARPPSGDVLRFTGSMKLRTNLSEPVAHVTGERKVEQASLSTRSKAQ